MTRLCTVVISIRVSDPLERNGSIGAVKYCKSDFKASIITTVSFAFSDGMTESFRIWT